MFGHRAHLQDPIRPVHILAAALIVAAGVWLRYRSALGDLWLDEIWSLNFAATMTAWHEAFWKVAHDNNHPLNTVYLYLIGQGREPWLYRVASIVAGGLSIAAAGWALSREGAGRMLVAMLCVAVVYPLVHFGSEARGYALMILFGFIAFGTVDRARDNPVHRRWLFGLAVMLGAASHLAILPIAFMMSIAYGLREWRAGRSLWDAIKITFWFSAPAAGGLAIVGGGIVYGLEHATAGWYGGRATTCPDEGCFIAAWDELVRFASGGFGEGLIGLHGGLFAILIIGAVLWLMMVGQSRAYLYAALFIGTPAIYLALGQPNVPYGRYFIGLFAFAPLVLADVMSEVRGRSKLLHRMMGVALLVLITANIWSITQFQRIGRGDYSRAYNLIVNNSKSDPITIGSDMTFRLVTVFDHLNTQSATPRTIAYTDPQNVSKERPDWLVTVMVEPDKMLDAICLGGTEDIRPVVYRLGGVFPYWGLSGTHWGVYRQVAVPWTKCP